MASTAFRGFLRRLSHNGGWLPRVAIGDADTTPSFPPLYVKPTSAPSGTAAIGDFYVGTDGVLYGYNGTNWVPGGGANVILPIPLDAAANAVDKSVFTADRAYQLVSIEEVHGVASTSGTLDLEKCTGTTAPGSGTSMCTGTISLAGAANTTVAGTLSATPANTKLADGDRLAFDFGGTMTNLVGSVVTIVLRPI